MANSTPADPILKEIRTLCKEVRAAHVESARSAYALALAAEFELLDQILSNEGKPPKAWVSSKRL